jgi:hypothetical protein
MKKILLLIWLGFNLVLFVASSAPATPQRNIAGLKSVVDSIHEMLVPFLSRPTLF